MTPFTNTAPDPWEWYFDCLSGLRPPIHEGEPQCGYFKVRDRRGLNRDLAPIKRPFIPAAIWIDGDKQYRAVLFKTEVPVDSLWPYIAKHPIRYEEYRYFHENECWPEKEQAK